MVITPWILGFHCSWISSFLDFIILGFHRSWKVQREGKRRKDRKGKGKGKGDGGIS